MQTRPVPWSVAMQEALYAPGGFYLRPEGPAGHFRTSVSASELFASAIVRLLSEVDEALGQPARLDFVDMGAGRGRLLVGVASTAPEPLRRRLRLWGVDLAPAPEGLPSGISWRPEPPETITGLVVANEWLDNVPVDVATVADGCISAVHVDRRTGEEHLCGPPAPADLDWLRRWWPLDPSYGGARAEIGRLRDEAWANLVRRIDRGVAVAIDYATALEPRRAGHHAGATLTGYRAGRVVAPVPDGSCDLTADVALDACAAAGLSALGSRAGTLRILRQRDALLALGVETGGPLTGSAMEVLARLQRRGEAAELLNPNGLGGFSWLVQAVAAPLPDSLGRAAAQDVRRD